jgi:hypothetical protein
VKWVEVYVGWWVHDSHPPQRPQASSLLARPAKRHQSRRMLQPGRPKVQFNYCAAHWWSERGAVRGFRVEAGRANPSSQSRLSIQFLLLLLLLPLPCWPLHPLLRLQLLEGRLLPPSAAVQVHVCSLRGVCSSGILRARADPSYYIIIRFEARTASPPSSKQASKQSHR